MKKGTVMTIRRLALISMALLVALAGCEDTLTPLVREDVRLARLPDRILTILPPANGSVTPVGTLTIKDNEPLGVAATPNGGYIFVNWVQTAGAGTAAFANADAATTSVRLTGGDATIQPVISDVVWNMTMTTDGHGWTSPTGTVLVANDTPRAISASPYGTYVFNNWTFTGTGTVTFLPNATSASATATVTGGNVTVRANFRKENVTLSQVGSLAFSNFTTYPDPAEDTYFYNNYLYVLGTGVSGSSVVRRFNMSSPAAPSTGSDDYRYLTGIPEAIIGDGTYLFAGTSSSGGNIHRLTIASFGPSMTVTNPSSAVPVLDLAIYPASATYLWAITGGTIKEFDKNLYTGYYVLNPTSGYSFQSLEKTPFELLAVEEDNGAHNLASYDVDSTAGATWTAPDSSVALHTGGDMDPGSVQRIAKHVDGEWVAAPVSFSGEFVKNYAVDDPYGIGYSGQATVSGEALCLALDDYYIYVGAQQGGVAYIYVVDASVPSAPVVRTSFEVTTFERVDAVYVNGSYLYAIVDSAASEPVLKVYLITRN